MTIRPITSTHPACYGVCCPNHTSCARYALVETTTADSTIATCEHPAGVWPLLVVRETEDVHG